MYPIYKIRLLNINPSSLSNTPPWPGRNLPESFIECFLLTQLSKRSPNWVKTARIKPKIKPFKREYSLM